MREREREREEGIENVKFIKSYVINFCFSEFHFIKSAII